jgi:hypothetical protein
MHTLCDGDFILYCLIKIKFLLKVYYENIFEKYSQFSVAVGWCSVKQVGVQYGRLVFSKAGWCSVMQVGVQ